MYIANTNNVKHILIQFTSLVSGLTTEFIDLIYVALAIQLYFLHCTKLPRLIRIFLKVISVLNRNGQI